MKGALVGDESWLLSAILSHSFKNKKPDIPKERPASSYYVKK